MRRLSESELIQVVAEMERRYRQEMGAEEAGERDIVESPLPLESPDAWDDSTQPKIPLPQRESGVVVLRTRKHTDAKTPGAKPPGDEPTISRPRSHSHASQHTVSRQHHAIAYQPVAPLAKAPESCEEADNITVTEIPLVRRSGQFSSLHPDSVPPGSHEKVAAYESGGVRTGQEGFLRQSHPSHTGWLGSKNDDSLSYAELHPNPHSNGALGSALYNRSFSTGELQIPSLLGTRFHLQQMLGQGRLGRIFLADDVAYGGQYAIRLLHPWITQPDDMLEGFARAFKQLERLHHPSIARVYFMGPAKEPGTLFYSMEYIEGRTLEALQAEQTPFKPDGHPAFSPEDAFFFLEQLCDVLAYAHNRNIVHGDLKANNIMVVDGPCGRELRLMDFGLTQIATRSRSPQLEANQTAQFFYTAPDEQTKEVTPARDVFSLGVLFYRWLTGLIPAGWVISPSQVNDSLPVELDAVFQKAMHPDRQSRYSSVEELYQAVREVLQPTHILSAPVLSAPAPLEPTLTSSPAHELLANQRQRHGTHMDVGVSTTAAETPTVARKLLEESGLVGAAEPALNADSFTTSPLAILDDSESHANITAQGAESTSATNAAEHSQSKVALAATLVPLPFDSSEDIEEVFSHLDDDEIVTVSPSQVMEILSGEFDELTAEHQVEDEMIFGEPSFIPESTSHKNELVTSKLFEEALRQLNQARHTPPPVVEMPKILEARHCRVSLNHLAVVEEMACSPNGLCLLTIDQELMIRLWDTKTWKLLHAIPKERGSVGHLCWSSNSRRFAFCSGPRRIDIWDAQQCKHLRSINLNADILQLTWLANESSLAVGCTDSAIHLWNVEEEKETAALTGYRGVGHVFAFQPTCALFLSGNNSGQVRIWPLSETSGHVVLYRSDYVITALAAARSLPLLLCGDSSGEVSFWDLSTKSQLYAVQEHKQPIYDVGISADGTCGYSIDESGLVLVYNLNQGKVQFTHQITSQHDSHLCIEPNGQWLATSNDNNVDIWNISL